MAKLEPALIKKLSSTLHANSTIATEKSILKPHLHGTEGLEFFDDKKRQIAAVVTITKSGEIKKLLDLANQYADDEDLAFTLYPISTGNNWGYGSSQPSGLKKNIILLDLRSLNHIISFDEELGLITLEPGVTQQQLSDFLEKHDEKYMVPVTGAGPDCSVVANALERGYGITPYTDHFSAVTRVNGYWADGSVYQSALEELDISQDNLAAKSYKWGLGPYCDGLFTQSNFGIVSQMTIRLAKKPQGFVSFFIQLADESLLEQAQPIVKKILQDYEGIIGAINLMDKRRLISMFSENPTNEKHQTMERHTVDKLAKGIKAPNWTIVGSIYGTPGVVKVVKQEIKTLFKQLPCKQAFSDSPSIILANKVVKHLPKSLIQRCSPLTKLAKQLTSFNLGKSVMLGKPNKIALNLCYWRNKKNAQSRTLCPAHDGCGLLWYAPIIPMKVEKIREFINLIREICPKHNIEPFITLTCLKHDCIDSSIPIVFELGNPEAVSDAHNCLAELVSSGLAKGFVPYRLNIDQQQHLLDKQSDFWQLIAKIKSAVDPKKVLSVGRYNP